MASSPYAISHVHTSAQTLLLTCLQTANDPALQTSTVGDDTVRDDACAGIHGLGPSPVAHQVVVWRMCRGSHRVQHGAKLRHDVLTVSRHVATVGIMIQWGDLVVLCGGQRKLITQHQTCSNIVALPQCPYSLKAMDGEHQQIYETQGGTDEPAKEAKKEGKKEGKKEEKKEGKKEGTKEGRKEEKK